MVASGAYAPGHRNFRGSHPGPYLPESVHRLEVEESLAMAVGAGRTLRLTLSLKEEKK
jgi:hypothetical protein